MHHPVLRPRQAALDHPPIQQLGDMESNYIKHLITVIVLLREVRKLLLLILRNVEAPARPARQTPRPGVLQ